MNCIDENLILIIPVSSLCLLSLLTNCYFLCKKTQKNEPPLIQMVKKSHLADWVVNEYLQDQAKK